MTEMSYDEAVDIAHNASSMTLEQLLEHYEKFNAITDNTPDWMMGQVDGAGDYVHGCPGSKPMGFQRLLHAVIGKSTEAAEMLDAIKKELYGKQRPMRPENIREELGDDFYYTTMAIRALRELGHPITLKDIIKDNVVKLANRYIEKFGR